MPALPWTSRTVSVWQSRDELDRFAAARPHATIIRTKPERMGQSKFVFWTCVGHDVPIGWDVVAEHLDVSGGEARASLIEPAGIDQIMLTEDIPDHYDR